jgi:aquaporin Z
MTSLGRKLLAEFIGTFWLVFAGCGSAVLAAKVIIVEGSAPINIGIALVGVALAFGLAVMAMAYAIGHVSGCHLNPAVSLGLLVGRRFSAAEFIPYVIAQVAGGLAGAGLLFYIASANPKFTLDPAAAGAFASNGYGDRSPGGYPMPVCFVAETVLTAFFLIIIMGATHKRAPAGFAPIAIGLGLTGIHLVGIPITNLSVNPARSTASAVFVGGAAIQQLWLFWAAPLLGGLLGGLVYAGLAGDD